MIVAQIRTLLEQGFLLHCFIEMEGVIRDYSWQQDKLESMINHEHAMGVIIGNIQGRSFLLVTSDFENLELFKQVLKKIQTSSAFNFEVDFVEFLLLAKDSLTSFIISDARQTIFISCMPDYQPVYMPLLGEYELNDFKLTQLACVGGNTSSQMNMPEISLFKNEAIQQGGILFLGIESIPPPAGLKDKPHIPDISSFEQEAIQQGDILFQGIGSFPPPTGLNISLFENSSKVLSHVVIRNKIKKKSLQKPKAPANLFNLFCKSEWEDMQNKISQMKLAPNEINQLLGKTWKKLSLDQKQPFLSLAEADKIRYKEEMKMTTGKQPLSDYNYFVRQETQFISNLTSKMSCELAGKHAGSRWNVIDASEKRLFEIMRLVDQEIYEKQFLDQIPRRHESDT